MILRGIWEWEMGVVSMVRMVRVGLCVGSRVKRFRRTN